MREAVLLVALTACRPPQSIDASDAAPPVATTPPPDAAPAAAANGCDATFSMHLSGVAEDDIPGSNLMATTPEHAIARGAPCYAPGPHLDFNGANWCCKPGTRITAYGACDPRFPKHLKDVKSIDDVPDGRGMATTADDATARKLACYAPGPHTAFNIAHWCCRAPR
jgi:hypothetical protein